MKIASAAISALPSLASASGGMPAGRAGKGRRSWGSLLLLFMLMAFLLLATSLPALATDGDTWTTKASMATGRDMFAVAVVDGKIYAIGGRDSSSHVTNSVEEYDPATNIWTTKASMATARRQYQVAVVDGKIYAIGGSSGSVNLNSVEKYDPTSNTWATMTSMATARSGHDIAVVNSKIYAIGGYDGNNRLNSVEMYDPATNTWTTKASMATTRSGHNVAVVNEKIYVIGGSDGSNIFNSVEEYNPITNTWTPKASMATARSGHDTVVIDGKIYVMGGAGTSDKLSSTEEYNPATNIWTTKASMAAARIGHDTVVIDGKIYVIGGANGNGTNCLNLVEEYDPAANTWTTKASMATVRSHHGAAVFDGKIYAIGGYDGSNYLNSVEEYTPQTAPEAPVDLTATAGDAQVSLSWTALSGANGYNVLRATTAGGPYTAIASNITETSYPDSGLTNGTTYYYVVTAVNSAGESGYSNEASATPAAAAITGKAFLVITLIDGTEKEYDLTMNEVNAFVAWYDAKATGTGKAYYIFNNNMVGPFTSRKDYIVFDKIMKFEIMQYQ